MQLQSRSLAVKARRSANFETAPHFGPHHRSDEIYLAIVVAVLWARQHASQASDLRKDEGKPQFSTAFLDGGGVQHTTNYAHRRRGSVFMSTSVAFFAESAFFNASLRSRGSSTVNPSPPQQSA